MTEAKGLRPNSYVLDRIAVLRDQNKSYFSDRWRIRNIMNGGAAGIAAIMAWDNGKGSSGKMNSSGGFGEDLPAANYMASGVERLAQKVGQPPTLKMPYGYRDSGVAREAAEKRERIVEGWDHLSAVNLHYPQIGRWLPGYGYYAWVLRPRKDTITGQLYPHTELRDPFDTWPGYFGAGQQPTEVAFVRSVPCEALEKLYPDLDWKRLLDSRKKKGPADPRRSGRSQIVNSKAADPSWEGLGGGTQVIEYYDDTGIYVCAPEFEAVLDYIPNVCETGAMFVLGKRYSFDRLLSQYHHVIGMVAHMAKLNVLGLIAAEDSVFRETNIIGDIEGNTYDRGRWAVNFFEPGTKIDRPTSENNAQLFAQIDRLERQLRIGAAYDQGSDSIAAQGGFITGRGQQELRDPVDANIAEYQKVIAYAAECLDTRRLEWEERHELSKKKRVFYLEGDKLGQENYVPSKDIGGNWRSRRVYGMMASWDESSKIVGGLQLLQGGIIDRITMQENLSGLDNVAQINQRINSDRAGQGLFAALEQMAAQNDPKATMALVNIKKNPDRTDSILEKFFTPEGDEMSPEEQAMAALNGGAMAGGQPVEMGGPPPSIQTVLSELAGTGQTRSGAQTVSVRRNG